MLRRLDIRISCLASLLRVVMAADFGRQDTTSWHVSGVTITAMPHLLQKVGTLVDLVVAVRFFTT